MLEAGEAVEFIQFDVGGSHFINDRLIGRLGLCRGASNPALHRGGMRTFNPRDGFRAQSFQRLMEGALEFLLWRLEIIEGRAIAVAESFPALPTAADKDDLAIPQAIAAVIG